MSHKIKFNLNKQKNNKPLEDQPNEKISISISSSAENKNKIENTDKKNAKAKKILEQFNNSNTGLVVIDGKLIEKPVLREMKRKILIADKINKS